MAPVLDLPDLDIIYSVYEAAWAKVVATDPFRDPTKDAERKAALRTQIFALAAGSSLVNFDTLCEKVLASMSEPRAMPSGKKPRGSPPQVGA